MKKCCDKFCSRHTCTLCGKVVNPKIEKTLTDCCRIAVTKLGLVSLRDYRNYIQDNLMSDFSESHANTVLSLFRRRHIKKKSPRKESEVTLSNLMALKDSIRNYGGMESFEKEMEFWDGLVNDFGGILSLKKSLNFLRGI